jgi:hypothetical protein
MRDARVAATGQVQTIASALNPRSASVVERVGIRVKKLFTAENAEVAEILVRLLRAPRALR